MENSHFNTNNPYKRQVNPQPTLPLEPRVPRSEQEADEAYKPKPPRPTDAVEPAEAPKGNDPAGIPMQAPTQASTPAPARKYEIPASYSESGGFEGAQPHQPHHPASGNSMRQRPTVTYTPGQQPPISQQQPQASQQPQRPDRPQYPDRPRPGKPTVQDAPAPQRRPTVTDQAPQYRHHNPAQPNYPPRAPQAGSNRMSKGVIIGIAAVALLLIGGACWWYLKSGTTTPDETHTEEVNYSEAALNSGEPVPTTTPTTPMTSATSDATAATESAGIGSESESTSLFNRPLTYTGTVTPGGVASLNVILFQNGRIEGSIDYSDGKSMPLFGSYTWIDNGHRMNVNFTVSSPNDKTYSESWMGQSSVIKDNLAHTLTFKRINTSNGQSMTASFALR